METHYFGAIGVEVNLLLHLGREAFSSALLFWDTYGISFSIEGIFFIAEDFLKNSLSLLVTGFN